MTTNNTQEQEQILRQAFRTMDAHQAQAIREAYYKAVEGLHSLAEKLEIADIGVGDQNDHALIGSGHRLGPQRPTFATLGRFLVSGPAGQPARPAATWANGCDVARNGQGRRRRDADGMKNR